MVAYFKLCFAESALEVGGYVLEHELLRVTRPTYRAELDELGSYGVSHRLELNVVRLTFFVLPELSVSDKHVAYDSVIFTIGVEQRCDWVDVESF